MCTLPAKSSTPAGYSSILQNSDTTYLEIALDPTSSGLSSLTLPHIRPNCRYRLSPVLLTNWLCIGGSHHSLLCLIICERMAHRTQKCPMYYYQFIVKHILNEQPNEEIYRMRSARVLSRGVLVMFKVCPPASTWMLSFLPTWKLSRALQLGFLWRFTT